MHIGMSVIFQNTGRTMTDREVYVAELAMAARAEDLGFESIWTVEHHFTDYTMSPSPMQFLSFLAGRTKTALLGSMVMVLPWHQPIRVAEEIALADHLSDGRLILGIGRGSGRVEFDGFGLDMGESRERFLETAHCVLDGLEQGWCEADGEFVKQTRRDIRPAPFKSFRERTYGAAVSPETATLLAELGVGMLIIPQKPWVDTLAELEVHRTRFEEVHGHSAPPPVVAAWVYCDADADRAQSEGRRWIGEYYQTVIDHYGFNTGHLNGQKGYEYYSKMAERLNDDAKIQKTKDWFADIQVYGTPDQCIEKLQHIAGLTGTNAMIGVFRYAGMPVEQANASMDLFAREVRPVLQATGAGLLAPVAGS